MNAPHKMLGRLDRKGHSGHDRDQVATTSRVAQPIAYRYTGAGCVGPWRETSDDAGAAFDELWRERTRI